MLKTLSIVLAVSAPLFWGEPLDFINKLQGARSFDGRSESMQPAFLWKDSLRTIPKLPGIRGIRDTAWIYIDDDWRNPVRYHIRRELDGLYSNWSNDVIVGWPPPSMSDIYFLHRYTIHSKCFTQPRRPNEHGLLVWNLAVGDTLPFSIVTQEFVQNSCKPEICGAYQLWWNPITGLLEVCP